jgi:hypothetical protein
VQDVLELLAELDWLAIVGLDLTQLLLLESRSVGVEAEKDLLVLERVLLLHVATLGVLLALGSAENGLDFGGVDETGKVGLGDDVGGEEEVLLEVGRSGGGAVDLVQALESGGGPDDEAAEVTTGGELEEVEGMDGACLNTGNVAETLDEVLSVNLGVVDNQRSTALAVTTTPQLTLTGTELLGKLNLVDVGTSTDGLQEPKSSGGLGVGGTVESGGVDNQGNLGNGVDLVATGKEKGGDGRSSQSGSGSETPKTQLDIAPSNHHRKSCKRTSVPG